MYSSIAFQRVKTLLLTLNAQWRLAKLNENKWTYYVTLILYTSHPTIIRWSFPLTVPNFIDISQTVASFWLARWRRMEPGALLHRFPYWVESDGRCPVQLSWVELSWCERVLMQDGRSAVCVLWDVVACISAASPRQSCVFRLIAELMSVEERS